MNEDDRIQYLLKRRDKDEAEDDLFWVILFILISGLIGFSFVALKLFQILGV